ncbi:proton-coupled zinc antiporter SLC30A1-like [Hydractinia symbiolongicarpus]|uniref:proton-coupled zinc antiporter SLC30A1-like n=1 Tax=Hydractinia symbiolongicarpus TaxID=13093 RepID=UPI00254B5CDB|nr:proton-coupled zinc antiporter SLC30A1-like [Hydractinia symbiolongicarpus]
MAPSCCCQLSQRTSFISMIGLTTIFFLVEIIVGYITKSMALVADSFHMLSDVVSLLVGYIALRYSKKRQQTGRYTFGWARAEVLGALVNAVFLAALCFSIFVEALKRMILPEEIEDARLVLITGGIGLLVNLIGLFLFHQHGHSHGGHGHSHGGHGHSHGGDRHSHVGHGHSHGHSHADGQNNKKKKEKDMEKENTNESPLLQSSNLELETIDLHTEPVEMHVEVNVDGQESVDAIQSGSSSQLNIRGVYLHVLGDALGSVIVMISALIILFEDGRWVLYVDPAMSILLVLIILKTSVPLLKESAMILMQTVPTHIKIQEIQERLVERIPGVLGVHEFHIWQLAGNRIIASAHVRCNTLADYMAIANQLKEFFHNEGIHSTTIQPEFSACSESLAGSTEKLIDACVLECDENCAERTCCGNTSAGESARDANKKESRLVETETETEQPNGVTIA